MEATPLAEGWKTLNFNGGRITPWHIQMILEIINRSGEVHLTNVGQTSAMELLTTVLKASGVKRITLDME